MKSIYHVLKVSKYELNSTKWSPLYEKLLKFPTSSWRPFTSVPTIGWIRVTFGHLHPRPIALSSLRIRPWPLRWIPRLLVRQALAVIAQILLRQTFRHFSKSPLSTSITVCHFQKLWKSTPAKIGFYRERLFPSALWYTNVVSVIGNQLQNPNDPLSFDWSICREEASDEIAFIYNKWEEYTRFRHSFHCVTPLTSFEHAKLKFYWWN